MRFPTTILLIAIAAASLTAAIYDIRGNGIQSFFSPKPRANASRLIDVDINTITEMRVTAGKEQPIVLKKNTNADGWSITEPHADRADVRRIAAIAKFINDSTIIDSITLDDVTLENIGLGEKETKIELIDATGTKRQAFAIGNISSWKLEAPDDKEPTKVDLKKPPLKTVYARILDPSQNRLAYVVTDPTQQVINLVRSDVTRLRDHRPFFVNPADISEINLKSQRGDIVLKRENDKAAWMIEKPIKLKTDATAIKSLLGSIINLEALTIESSEHTTPAANDLPSISITTFSGAKTTELKLLEAGSPASPTIKAATNDRKLVFDIPALSSESTVGIAAFPSSINALRYRSLTSVNPKGLKSIVLRGSAREDLFLTREFPEDKWQFFRRDKLETIEEETLFNFLTSLTKTPVVAFVSDAATDLKEFGLDQPDLAIALVGFDNKAFQMRFRANSNGNVLVCRVGEPHIYAISEETFAAINSPNHTWRNKRLWSLDRVDVRRLTLTRKNALPVTLNYKFASDTWNAKEGDTDRNADFVPARANKLIERMENLHVYQWLGKHDKKAFETLIDPDLIIDLETEDTETGELILRSLRIASVTKDPNNRWFYGHLSDETDYFKLDLETVRALANPLFEKTTE